MNPREIKKHLSLNFNLALLITVGYFLFPVQNIIFANSDFDWRQWRGPNRDGISTETGLLKSWPPEGPKELWRTTLGEGFSSISVANGKAFTMFTQGSSEYAACFDANSGKEIWHVQTDEKYINSWGNGPRATPGVDHNMVYFASARAKLYAIDIESGKIVWQHDLVKAFGCLEPDLGYSNSPMIINDLVLVTGGGEGSKGIMAFDKNTGKLRWNQPTRHPGYSSPILIDVGNTRQAIFFAGTEIVSLSPVNGKRFWQYSWGSQWNENVATPVFIPNNFLFFSSAHPRDKGSVVLEIAKNNSSFIAEPLWKNNAMQNHFSSTVLRGDFLYGTDRSILKCINVKTGEEQWRQRGFGEGTLILADQHLIVLGTSGLLGLVEATPEAYREKGLVQVLSGKCYAPPSLANGKLFIRSPKEMVCLDLHIENEIN